MLYDKEALLKLPIAEKQALAEALWNSIDDVKMPVTEDDIKFAEDRYKIHLETPDEGLTWNECKDKLKTKYGF